MTQQFPSYASIKEKWKRMPTQSVVRNTRGSIIYKSQKVEITQMSNNCWMGGQNVVCLYQSFIVE